MSTTPEYKDCLKSSGTLIPRHWEHKALKWIVTRTNAGEVIDKSHWGGSQELLYTCAIDPLPSDFPNFPDTKRTTDDDLLLTRNGTPYVHKPVKNSIYTNVVQRITLAKSVSRDYVALSLGHAALSLKGYGVSIESLNYDMWKELLIAIPPIEEQNSIVNFLNHEISKIDDLVKEQVRLIDLLKEQRLSMIAQSVTKGIDSNVNMKESGVEWLGSVPDHWEVLPLKRFFKLIVDLAPDDNNLELLSLYTEIGVRPRKELEARGNRASTTDGYFKVSKGDIVVNKLLAWMGALAVSEYDGVTSPAYDILRANRPLSPHYYDHLFRCGILNTEFRKYSRGIMDMRLRLYFEEFGQFLMPFPPYEEQLEIVENLRNKLRQFDELSDEAQKAIGLLHERRSALISAAVTGRIDVRNMEAA